MQERGLRLSADPTFDPTFRVLETMGRGAIDRILRKRFNFTRIPKRVLLGEGDDFCTDADLDAQAFLVERARNHFPNHVLICEEDCDVVETAPDRYLTLDSLDGTEAFVYGNLQGVSSMSAQVCHGKVTAACIVDILGDAYGYGPDSDGVYLVTAEDESVRLDGAVARPDRALLRRPLDLYSPVIQKLVGQCTIPHENTRGSVGVWITRFLKGEFLFAVLWGGSTETEQEPETPWDMTPMKGACKEQGCLFLQPTDDGKALEHSKWELVTEPMERKHDILIIHKNNWATVAPFVRS